MTSKQSLDGALSALREISEFAYAQGFHEMGYDPLEVIRSALHGTVETAAVHCTFAEFEALLDIAHSAFHILDDSGEEINESPDGKALGEALNRLMGGETFDPHETIRRLRSSRKAMACTYPDCKCSPLDNGKPRERCGRAEKATDLCPDPYCNLPVDHEGDHDDTPAHPKTVEKLKYPRLERRPLDENKPAQDWCLAFYVTDGGAAQRFKPGEPVTETIATLRRLADILERTTSQRARGEEVNNE